MEAILDQDISLYPYQERCIEEVFRAWQAGYRSVVLVCPTGCHHPDQLILMHDGSLKRAADIQVGDSLMGMDSTPRRVLRLHRGSSEMQRIIPVKGESFVVNMDHVLTLQKTREMAKGGEGRESHCQPGDLIDISVRYWLKWSKTKKHLFKLVRSSGVHFPERCTGELSAYFLGIVLGDGSIGPSCCITSADKEIIAAFRAEGDLHGLQTAVVGRSKWDTAPTFCISGGHRAPRKPNTIAAALKSLGLWGKRSADKFVPVSYKTGSKQVRLSLLAGLIDTDGSLSHGGYDYISQSLQLASDVAFIARSLGLAAYMSPCEKRDQHGNGGQYYRVSISGDIDAIPCRLDRKKASPRMQKKSVLRTGFAVESAGMGEYFGFEVDGDHRYLMGDFTVTHNSGKTRMFLWIMQYAQRRNRKVLFVGNRRLLVHQASAAAAEQGLEHGIIMANTEEGQVGSGTQFASIQTLESWYFYEDYSSELSGKNLPHANLVAIDEVHAEGRRYRQLLELYPDAKFLCLTATPVGANGTPIVPAVFEKLVEPIKNSELIRDGYLLSTTVYAPSEPDIEGVRVEGGREYNQVGLGKAVRSCTVFADVFREWDRYKDRATVCFVPGIAFGRDLCLEWNNRVGHTFPGGKGAFLIEAKTPQAERRRIYDLIRDLGRGVLISYDVLKAGFDLPVLSVGLDLQPNNQLRDYWQKLGRTKRAYPGQLNADWLDFAGNYWRFPHPNDDPVWPQGASQTTQDVIRERRESKKDSQPIICPRCSMVRPGGSVCPGCKHQSSQSIRRVRMEDGTLKEMPAENPQHKEITDEKRAFNNWQGTLFGALARGWTFAQCLRLYKQKTGEWPKSHWPGVYEPGSLESKRRPADEFTKSSLYRWLKEETKHHEW